MRRIVLSILLGVLVVGCGSADKDNADQTEETPVVTEPEVIDPPALPSASDASEPGAAWLERVRGLSLEEAFEAVARDIGYEPYPGVLRGPEGTARAGSGNALDQALLLAEVVGEQVTAYRFAQGRLAPERVAALLASMHPADAPRPAFSPDEYDLYDPTQDAVLQRWARDHVWLEVQQADSGAWLPLDPSYPGAQIGEAFAEAGRTFDTPPNAMMQTLTVRFMQETEDGRTRRLGQVNGAVAELAQEPITLAVRGIPQREQPGVEGQPSGPLGGLGGTLGGGLRGGQQDEEDLEEMDAPAEPGPLFGTEYRRELWHSGKPSTLAATLVRDDDPASRIRREWIEFDLRVPGQPARKLERTLYDAGSGAGDGPPGYRRYTITLLSGPVSEAIFVARRQEALQGLDAWNALLRDLQQQPATNETALEGLKLEATTGGPVGHLINLAFAAASDALTESVAAANGITVVHALPRILISSVETRQEADGSVRSDVSLDLRLDAVRAVPQAGMPALAAEVFQRARGMQESALEGRVLARFVENPEAVVTTAALLRQAQDQGKALVLVTPDDRAALEEVEGLPASDVARINQALDAGDEIIVPEASVTMAGAERWGWWQVDAETGAFVGVLEGGRHQAMVQYTVTLAEIGVNDDMGFVLGLLNGTNATLLLLAAKILEYGQITEAAKQEVAALIEYLTCVTCPSFEVKVSLGADASIGNDCFKAGLGTGLEGGVGGSVAFCEKYKKGIACAASVLLNGLEVKAEAGVSGGANTSITPLDCDR